MGALMISNEIIMVENCTAVILAGGESRRMGQDKASIQLANTSLLHRIMRNVQPLFEQVFISMRQPRQDLPLPFICDQSVCNQPGSHGPMSGVATALEYVETDWVFAIACDMPFISPALIRALANKRGEHAIVVAMVHGHLQPLAAFYAKSCLPQMQQQLADGNRSLKTLIGTVDALTMQEQECVQHDSELLSFFDLDTKEDLARAEVVLQENV